MREKDVIELYSEDNEQEIVTMEPRGQFAKILLSLELQLKTLLDDVGGSHAASFLDALAKLRRAEQTVILPVFRRALERLIAGSIRLDSKEDQSLRDFEEALYQDLVKAIQDKARPTAPTGRIVEVIDGGKAKAVAGDAPIDLAEERRRRVGGRTKGTVTPVGQL